ncbi:MAG: acyl CoA:acetate/3-ketoacid CoA transferase [Verrucomicrobiales bacterium]|nr:acyl CoA:acetate/3-ketoacid CoA transferase [Verrucomicrobiales bacterium]
MNPVSNKLCTADEAVANIADGDWIVSGGFVGAAHPEALTSAIERRFETAGQPRDLTLVYAAGQGDAKSRGLNHLGHEGLLKRVIVGHWGLAPKIGKLAIENKIEATNFPQGVICQILRDIAAGRPGCITHVGLDTFIDPIHRSGRLNDRTPPGRVERVELNGRTWLFYHAFPLQVGLIRATEADCLGNLTMDEEAIIGEVLPIAQAVRNSGGTVIAQVKRVSDSPAQPHRVAVPAGLVDRIVISEYDEHDQTFSEAMNLDYVSPYTEMGRENEDRMPLNARRIIAARACDELKPGMLANLGIGMPEGVARIAEERGLLQDVTLSLESGPIGGRPAGGLSFGASAFPQAIVDQPAQFDFYDGGGLDFAALGLAQADASGNVNVSQFGTRLAGVGGFVNISQNARSLVFCGTFTSGGLEIEIVGGILRIRKEGRARKFVAAVEQISFSGKRAIQNGQPVLFVTERAVFRLTEAGLQLIEEAPGVDRQKQILDLMDFDPIIESVAPMPPHLFE